MNTKDIVFVHGWGEDSRIWDEMAEHFPEHNHHFIDLGFIGEVSESILKISDPAIFVTHSLGTLWVLNHIPSDKIAALAAINGFGCFTDFASNKTLENMAKSLQRNIFLQMVVFWKDCNFPQNMRYTYKHELNKEKLSQGLIWLRSWDKREKLQDLKTQNVPILSLGGQEDLILPPELMRKHWNGLGYDVVMRKKAGHSLPLEAPRWCVEQIIALLGKDKN
jgi:pimeloyl-[acyl-carrier protein] methyl ester esterase